MPDKNAVIWGAGRIGRGFMADLFYAAGYQLTLIDQSVELIAQLRQAGQYTVVQAANAEERHDQIISGYTALLTTQSDEIAAAILAASSLAVAVFPQDFPSVARQLVPGLARRQKERPDVALDIILCTNLSHAAVQFQAQLQEVLPPELQAYAARQIGVVESLVIRMVVEPPAELKAREPLLVWTNGYPELPVDRHGFKGEIPRLPGLRLVDDMRAEEIRKLYTYNMCHAVLAYHGARRGHTLAVECLHDPQVRAEAEGALAEVGRALQLEYGFTAEEMARWNENVLRQTDNPTLGDTVARHGADPRRKLKRADRLVGPLLLVRKHGLPAPHLTRAIAAALCFRNLADAGAVYVQQRLGEANLAAVVRELCEFTGNEADLVEAIAQAYAGLKVSPS
jgi:mannitol-1-phosphate 5-dehydrogenase